MNNVEHFYYAIGNHMPRASGAVVRPWYMLNPMEQIEFIQAINAILSVYEVSVYPDGEY